MTDVLSHRLGVEGADPLLLAGVNDANLLELQRTLGIRASLRGDLLTLTGSAQAIERAIPVLHGMIELARLGESVSVEDVARLSVEGGPAEPAGQESDARIVFPGLKRPILPKTAGQRLYLQAIQQHDIVVGIGPAGTGKTYLAMSMAVAALMKNEVIRIVLARPAVEAGEKLGFLPGDLHEKVNPYLRPLYDALHDMMNFEKASKLVQRGVIEVAPLAFMRGRTLNDSFVILDEAQNTTSEQMKMFLTRLGFSSKAVITGDVTQIDLPEGKMSGLVEARKVLEGIKGIDFIYFTKKDVIRHPLVQEIIQAYEELEKKGKRF